MAKLNRFRGTVIEALFILWVFWCVGNYLWSFIYQYEDKIVPLLRIINRG